MKEMNELKRFILKYPYAYNFYSKFALFSNPNIDLNFAMALETPDFNALSTNLNITLETMRNHDRLGLSYRYFVMNPNCDPGFVIDNPDLFGDVSEISQILSCNPNVTYDFVLSHPEVKWDNDRLALFSKVKPGEITSRGALFSRNPHVEWYDVLTTEGDLHWHYDTLSKNPNITLDIIENFVRPWNKDVSPYYTFEMLQEDWGFTPPIPPITFMMNPNLTCDIFEKYFGSSDTASYFRALSDNLFEYGKKPVVRYNSLSDVKDNIAYG